MNYTPRTHLITSCTKGKNCFSPNFPALEIQDGTSADQALEQWLNQLSLAPQKDAVPAAALYRGSHWSVAKEIQQSARNLELWVISAGMGFLHSSDNVIPYEATFHQLPFSAFGFGVFCFFRAGRC